MTAPPPAPWWHLDRSLRSRLVAVATLAVVLAVSGVVVVAYAVVSRELRGPLDAQLRRQSVELQRQAAFGRGDPYGIQLKTRVGEIGGYAQVVTASGRSERLEGQEVSLPIGDDDLAVARGDKAYVLRDARVDGTNVRMLTSPLLPDFAVQVALPRTTVEAQQRRLAASFGLLAAVGIAIAAGLAWLVSRTALAPVTGLTEAAEQIAATRDLRLRIDETRRDELGRLATSFNTMLAALEQSVGSQRQLVADASHELRTPLASLRTNVEVLRRVDELPEGEREEILTAIVGQVEELTALVADVVELARGDEPEAAAEPVAYDEVVQRAVERARRNWPAAWFDVQTEPVTVRGSSRRIERAVSNLVDNAAKFSGEYPVVEVRLTADGRLTVHDNGPGVPAEALPHVFSRFFRGDEARGLPGSGLGLAIVKQAADSHGGSVSLRNHPEGGTVAELALPPA